MTLRDAAAGARGVAVRRVGVGLLLDGAGDEGLHAVQQRVLRLLVRLVLRT